MDRLLAVYELVKHFPVRSGMLNRVRDKVHAVDGVSFTLKPHETLGLVGESGCGKSTVGRALLQLIRPTSGQVWFQGQNLPDLKDAELRRLRREMQIIFQDPFSSLNPRLTVERIVEEPLITHAHGDGRNRRDRVAEALSIVGLLPEHMTRFPHEFSGGQRQRIMIARALILEPSLIIADEPVSALDVSVQAQVLNLLARLQARLKFSCLFISHDLGVVRYISHRVAVMYLGQIVELAPVEELYTNPMHPYTRSLLSAVPVPNPRMRRERIILSGDVPSPIHPPSGCRFHPRCPERMAICDKETPVMRQLPGNHRAACHRIQAGAPWTPQPPVHPAPDARVH